MTSVANEVRPGDLARPKSPSFPCCNRRALQPYRPGLRP